MKTVYDIMDKSENSLVRFDAAVEEASASKFIVAEKKISEILQTIAGSAHLYALVSGCTDGFDFKQCTQRLLGAEKNGAFDLNILDRRTRIAYVFSLLYSFDTRQNELLKFIQRFYGSNNVNTEYSEFCRVILQPFKYDVFSELSEAAGAES